MKVYILFFITYTILELVFTGFYFILVKKVDMTIIMGTAIYLFGMVKGYTAYQYARYQQKKRELLQSLP